MDIGELVVALAAVVGAGAGVGAATQALVRRARWKREFAGVPRGTTATQRLGPICVDGIARAATLLESPAHLRPCIAYKVVVNVGAAGGPIRKALEESRAVAFDLEDATGRLRVLAHDGTRTSFGGEPAVVQSQWRQPLPGPVAAWVGGRVGDAPWQTIEVLEWRLDPDEACTVVGTLMVDPAGTPGKGAGYRDAAPALVLGDGERPLLICDAHGEAALARRKR